MEKKHLKYFNDLFQIIEGQEKYSVYNFFYITHSDVAVLL